MRKLKLVKAQPLKNIDSYQPPIIGDKDEISKAVCTYRIERILSDTPQGVAHNSYPYKTVNGGVKPHPIFKTVFPEGRIPILQKDEADRLFATEIGYDKRSGYACRILANRDKIKIVVFPSNERPYIMHCFTGDRIK